MQGRRAEGSPELDEAASYGWLRGVSTVAVAVLTAAVVMLVLDLIFLGIIAKPFYDEALGELRAPEVYWPAALAFYAFYVGAIVWVAVLPARTVRQAWLRGSGLGLFAYAVYELTNWAVISGWPARLVPVDVAWGVALTGLVAAASYGAASLPRPDAVEWMQPFRIRLLEGEGLSAVWARRALSVSMMVALALFTWLAAPLLLAFALLGDTALGPHWLWARTRTVAFFMLYLANEVLGIAGATLIWLATAGGRIVSHRRYLDYNIALQRWWSEALLRGAFRIFSVRLEVEGQEVTTPGPFVLCARHVSTADTVLAASLVANPNRLLLKYVMKRELLWDPCLDIVGRRLPNAFIERASSDGQRAIEVVAGLGRELDDRSGVLIYPEGTRFSPAKRIARIARLRERGDEALANQAEGMQCVLPPRLGGVLALLDAAPGVDIVAMAHVGFEMANSFRAFAEGGLVGQTVRVKFWRIPAEDIPATDRDRWLFDRWLEVDAWVRCA